VFGTGLVIVGLTFGLLVRWALKPSPGGHNRAALAAPLTRVASLAAYGNFFTWAPVLIAPAALLLAREGLRAAAERDGRRYALAAMRWPWSVSRSSSFSWSPVATGSYPFGF
jgi:hypothetical protein